MEGLPLELHKLCREVLLRCEVFNSYDDLCDFCKGLEPLYFLHLQLKAERGREALFRSNLPILLEGKHRHYGYIFPIFLEALRISYDPNNDLWQALNDLCDRVRVFMAQHKPNPAQTSQSAQELARELFDLLIQIDFEDQVDLVRQTLQFHRVAAFLIHGKENFGQEILVTRLSQLNPELRNGRKIRIDVSSKSVRGSISQVWNQVANEFDQDMAVDDLLDQIVGKIFECWQTQHLIFIFYGVNRTPVGFLTQLLQSFWQPIVEGVNQVPGLRSQKCLVMFLVDHEGYVYQSEVP